MCAPESARCVRRGGREAATAGDADDNLGEGGTVDIGCDDDEPEPEPASEEELPFRVREALLVDRPCATAKTKKNREDCFREIR